MKNIIHAQRIVTPTSDLPMKVHLIRTFFFLGVIILSMVSYAQENGSVGIGVENPNPNAILHLVSPGNNQGLLIPALSTIQRTASSFQGNLTSVDNGLLVFDLNLKSFFYWQDNKWIALSAGNQDLTFNELTNELSIAGGNTIDLSTLKSINWEDIQNAPTDFNDADADPQNEIQDLELAGTVLKITNNSSATEIDLGNIISADNQDLTLIDNTLSLTNDLSVVDLSGYLDNTDNQNLSFDGVNINISGGTGIDVSAWDKDASDDFDGDFGSLSGIPSDLLDGDDVNDGDIDPTNEIQDLLLDGNLLTLSGNEPIDLSIYLDNTDDQDLSLLNNTLSLTNATSDVDLSSYLDNTDDQVIDQFDLSGTTLNLSLESDNVLPLSVDLSSINTDNQDLELSGSSLTLTNDKSPVDLSGFLDNTDNQDLSLTDNTLSLTNDVSTVDLGIYLDNTDAQSLSFNSGVLEISGGTGLDVTGWDTNVSDDFSGSWTDLANLPEGFDDDVDDVNDADADPTNEIQSITSGSGIAVEPVGNDFVISNSNPDQIVVLTDGGSGNLIIGGSYPNLSIDVPTLDDSDADATNEFQTISRTESEVTLSDGGGSFSIEDADADPGNEIQDISTDDTPGNITLSDGSSLNLNVDDADASPTNELITDSGLSGTMLSITDPGGTQMIELASLVNDSDADPTNEEQDLTFIYSRNELRLSHPDGSFNIIDLSDLNNTSPWTEDESKTFVTYEGQYALTKNFISKPKETQLTSSNFSDNKLNFTEIGNSKIVPIFIESGSVTLSYIEPGVQGQELILMIIGSGTLQVSNIDNLQLSSTSHSLDSGSTIHLVYYEDKENSTGFNGWMEVSVSISAAKE